ncbi:MAG: YkgJ family cysteine cluster protein [Saprospiraceae bacterium]|nr:YkgJ family cysteine cluster protein [Saprospiraceae bacterium]MCB9326577.1 YkgJ family cysteine cluster protein [Lewinellaceae bacterium]
MNNLLQQWKNKKDGANKKHTRFVNRLREQRGKHLDQWAESLHDEVFRSIDCMDCANCCTTIPAMVNPTDATRIAKHLKISESAFEEKYLTRDDDGDTVFKTSPCVFLQEDNACSIYEIRPKACREYPHTNNLEFSQNINVHAANSMYCPAVFHILERMMKNFPIG